MKLYKLRSEDGFFGLSVRLRIKQNEEMEKYCKMVLSYFHYQENSLLRNSTIYLRYMDFICSAILSICFDYFSKGKTPTEKQLLDELENRELIVYDEDIILQIPSIPLLQNIHFDLSASLKENNSVKEGNKK